MSPTNEGMEDNQKSKKILWTVLGFFFPFVVSVVLYFIWCNEKPVRANAIIRGMVIKLIIGAVFAVIAFVGYFAFMRFAVEGINKVIADAATEIISSGSRYRMIISNQGGLL